MRTANPRPARELRSKLIKVLWIGARQLGLEDPRAFAPQRKGITGEAGSTLSACTLEELQQIGFRMKNAGADIWVPAIPSGLRRRPTQFQIKKLSELLDRQTYLIDPGQFFKKRLRVKGPNDPTFEEAKRMIAYLATKERKENAIK